MAALHIHGRQDGLVWPLSGGQGGYTLVGPGKNNILTLQARSTASFVPLLSEKYSSYWKKL